MAYEKTFEAEFVRIKHKITFKAGTRAYDLSKMLDEVPSEATVDEVLEDLGSGESSIEFHEERMKAK